jgi:transcriptional repressor NrdR
MLCPSCGSDATKVVDSRAGKAGRVRKRRCPKCGQSFATVERIDTESLTVRKRDGRLEVFSRTKLVGGITKAAHLYALPPADVDTFVDRVVGTLQPNAPGFPISSAEIGRLVLQELQDSRAITDVARIRYALVFLGQRSRPSGRYGLLEFLHWLAEAYGQPSIEIPAKTPWRVLKRDGQIEVFELSKLERSLGIALKGRGSRERVRELASRIAFDVSHELQGQALVTSQQIAAEVVKLLLRRDSVAYLRYSSVMKRYRSTNDFWIDALALKDDDGDPNSSAL